MYRSLGTAADARAAEKAAGEWGALSRAELRDCGLTNSAIATRVRTGILHRLHHGVHAVGHAGVTMRGRFLAAVKACGPGSVRSHMSAAALWDLLTWEEDRAPDVIAPGKRRAAGVNVHQTRNRPQAIRYDRIPVTTPARTLADLSSVLPSKSHRRAVREALARDRITPEEAATLIPAAPAPTRSELEDLVLDLIERAGFAPPRVNAPLASGLIPDFRWPEQRLILEADGAKWHKDRDEDAARQARLEADGERVIRVTYRRARDRPEETVRRLEVAGVPRRIL